MLELQEVSDGVGGVPDDVKKDESAGKGIKKGENSRKKAEKPKKKTPDRGSRSGKKADDGSQKAENKRQRDKNGRFVKGHDAWKGTAFKAGNGEACKYKDEYAEMILEYFGGPMTSVAFLEEYDGDGKVTKRRPMVIVNEFPTFEAFATKIGVVTNTLRNWCEENEDFRYAYEMAKEMQLGKIKSGAMTGQYNALYAKFEAVNNHGMTDKQAVEFGTRTVELPKYADEEAN